ncbi:hypothetical protein ACKZDW_03735 (plasmid) [Ralstonia syzygii subsp. celebesensis]|uniref:hypothetical protein n=1 Tax=Ralstonia syzygii TaxID=28097 RepID=UPI0012FE3ADD|nr:hypothetical protein [Ralstonia syzygii]QQV58134.1 hypothetical protein JK151_22540 [Ralstonia syzygii subsp. celebesensis]
MFAYDSRRLHASVPVSADTAAETGTRMGCERASSSAFAETGTLFSADGPVDRPDRRALPGVHGTSVSGIMRSPGAGRLAVGHCVFHDPQ